MNLDSSALKKSAKSSIKGCKFNPYILTVIWGIVYLAFFVIYINIGAKDTKYILSMYCAICCVYSVMYTGYLWWGLSVARDNDSIGEFKTALVKFVPTHI